MSEISDPRQGKPSGSSFDRLVACPGSLTLINSLPPQPEVHDPDADRGIRLHKAWKKEDPTGLPAEDLEDYEAGLKHIASLVSTWQMETGVYDVKELPREERSWLNSENLEPLISGEPDRRYIGNGRPGPLIMLILDTKSGWLNYVADAASSWQLRTYGVIEDYNQGPLDQIRVALVKPKSKVEPIDFVNYHRDDIEHSRMAILQALWEAGNPNAPRTPGRHCRFCAAKAHCPEAAAYSLLPSVLAKGNSNGTLDIAQRVNAMAPADLVRVFDAMPIIVKIGEAVKQRLKGFSDEYLATLGLARGKGKQLDPIVAPKEAWSKIKELLAMPEVRLWQIVSMSKPALIQVLREVCGMTADGAKAFIARELAPFIEKKTSEPPLVRSEDHPPPG